MQERAYLIANTINVIIAIFVVVSVKRKGWITEAIFEKFAFVYAIPLMFFFSNIILNIIFKSGFASYALISLVLLIPGCDLFKDSISQRKTFKLYDKYESSIISSVKKGLHELGINVDGDDIKVFLTNRKEMFAKRTEQDACHVVIWLNEEQKDNTYFDLSQNIKTSLELISTDIMFDVTFRLKKNTSKEEA